MNFLLLAQTLLFKFLSFCFHAGQFLLAKLVVGIDEALYETTLSSWLLWCLFFVENDGLRVSNTGITQWNEDIIGVELWIALLLHQIAHLWWSSFVFDRILLSIDHPIKKIIVREQIVFQPLYPHDVVVRNESCSFALLHILHALSFAQVLLVLNNVHDAMNKWFVAHRVVFPRIGLPLCLLLTRSLYWFYLGHLCVPASLFASERAELLKLLRSSLFELLKTCWVQIEHEFEESFDFGDVAKSLFLGDVGVRTDEWE